jgi:anti-anti-sigma regulatory factor
MSVKRTHLSRPSTLVGGRASTAPAAATTTFTLHPRDEQARNANRHIPTWLDQVRDAGAHQASIDMSDVHRLDFSGFGVLLTRLRDVLRVTVMLTSVGVSEAVSLRSMGLLDGIVVEPRTEGRGHQTPSSGPNNTWQPDRVRIVAPRQRATRHPHSTGLNSEPSPGRSPGERPGTTGHAVLKSDAVRRNSLLAADRFAASPPGPAPASEGSCLAADAGATGRHSDAWFELRSNSHGSAQSRSRRHSSLANDRDRIDVRYGTDLAGASHRSNAQLHGRLSDLAATWKGMTG